MKVIQKRKINLRIPSILILLGLGFLVRIILSPFGTLALDQNTYIAWSMRLIQVGANNFYKAWSDYLPGYLYVLGLLAQAAKTNAINQTILYKLPAILSDIGTGYLIYRIVGKLKSENWARIAAVLYLFNPAIIANSTLWGQVDGLIAFFSLLSLYFLESNLYLSAIALAFGTLIKPQVALLALIILFIQIRDKWKFTRIFIYGLVSGLVFVGLFIPFNNSSNIFNFILERVQITLNQYPYTSVNAFNFWGIFGSWRPDSIFNQIFAFLVISGLFFVGVKKYWKVKGGEYILLSILYAGSFLFMTRMHERHLLPAFAPLTIAVAINPIFVFALVGFTFIYIANLYWAWIWVTENFREVFPELIVKILSLINVMLISIFFVPQKIEDITANFKNSFLRSRQTSWPLISFFGNSPDLKNNYKFEKLKLGNREINIIFGIIILFAILTRFYQLNNPPAHYFDEVYHGFTAQQMLAGNTKAWEWWNPNPTGFAYEWTHPPLAKEIMAMGLKVIGNISLGWRVPGAILGVGSIVLVYFIAYEIFEDRLLAVIASAALALDGLMLVMNRIGMNDSYILFFSLTAILAYLKKRNFWSAVFFGLALASKWSALWTIPIFIVGHFVFERKFVKSYIWFFIIPPLIYIATYFPLFTNPQIQNEYIQNTYYTANIQEKIGIPALDMFIDTQKQMWWYHTRLKATHPYTSPWYSWPFLVRPIYLYTSDPTSPEASWGEVSRIYAMGNPVVFWAGAGAVVVATYLAIKERNKKLGFVVFSYLVFFVPWALSPRIMFLYHYLPSVPYIAIILAYVLRRYKEFLAGFFILAIISFIYFYPHWAGLKIPLWLDTSYYWFSSWR